MPQVPYSPVPQVAPSTSATPGVSISTPIEAFGGGVAAAIGQAGKVVEHAGDEIFKRAKALQELENDNMAKEADTKYMLRAGELHAEFNSLEGKNAVDAFPRYMRDLQIMRRQYKDALPNPDTQNKFDSSSRQTMSRTIFNGAGHAASAAKTWTVGTLDAERTARRNNVLQNPTQESLDEAEITTANQADVMGGMRGWGPEQIAEWKRKERSGDLIEYIRGMAPKDPIAAKNFFEANRASIDGAQHDNVESVITRNLYTKGAIRISEEVNPIPQEGVEGPTLRDRLSSAEERAKALVPDDPNFVRAVRDKVTQDYNHGRGVLRTDQQNRDSVLIGGINGNHGKIPKTLPELLASSPEVSGAWDNTPEPRRRTILNMLAANSRGDSRPTAEGLERFQTLKGLAVNDPVEFLNVNIMEEFGNGMTRAELNQLSTLQQRIRQAPEQSPQMRQFLAQTRPIWSPAGLDRTRDKDRFDQFVGSAQDALVTFQKDNGRPPKSLQEMNQIATQLLTERAAPRTPNAVLPEGNYWWNRWGPSRSPVFEQAIPSEELTKFKDRYRIENERAPTDMEIRLWERGVRSRLYQQLYSSPKAK